MMRSMPPASAHLALMPVPAPPPMIGRPAATWARRRCRHSSRVKKLMGASQVFGDGGSRPYLIGQARPQPGEASRVDSADDARDLARLRRMEITEAKDGRALQTAAGPIRVSG